MLAGFFFSNPVYELMHSLGLLILFDFKFTITCYCFS